MHPAAISIAAANQTTTHHTVAGVLLPPAVMNCQDLNSTRCEMWQVPSDSLGAASSVERSHTFQTAFETWKPDVHQPTHTSSVSAAASPSAPRLCHLYPHEHRELTCSGVKLHEGEGEVEGGGGDGSGEGGGGSKTEAL